VGEEKKEETEGGRRRMSDAMELVSALSLTPTSSGVAPAGFVTGKMSARGLLDRELVSRRMIRVPPEDPTVSNRIDPAPIGTRFVGTVMGAESATVTPRLPGRCYGSVRTSLGRSREI
jgi:hypothetical protein